MKVTTKQLTKWFNEFNDKYFDSKLPMVTFTINNRCTSRLGQYNMANQNIDITNTYDREEKWFKETLLHEMIHHYTWVKYHYLGHGKYFSSMASYLNFKYGFHIHTYTNLRRDENIVPKCNKRPPHKLLTINEGSKIFVCFINENFTNLEYYKKIYNIKVFGISHDIKSLSKLPICRSRLSGKYFKKDDSILDEIRNCIIN